MNNPTNKKVLKNTMYLYIRMLVIALVSLFTTRIILKYLGVVDYGLYNVIGGIVAMFAFITSSLSNAVTRFFAYALGLNNQVQLKLTFQTTLFLYLIVIFLILILAETFGLWFLCHKLVIPAERFHAALVVYQTTIVSLLFTFFRIPYDSLIIAHEKMNFYAYVSIVETFLKLLVVYLLVIGGIDKLIFYGFLQMMVVILITASYYIYCKMHFEESKFGIKHDKNLLKEISSFACCNGVSTLGDVAINQGINVALNLFFGPAINAARGIAFQIRSQVANVVCNFQVASSPQITKDWASHNYEDFHKLIIQSSKISYYLLLLIAIPIIISMDVILSIWLENVPDYTVAFARLIMINALVDTMGGTLHTGVQAIGKILKYTICIGLLKILSLLCVYLLFRFYTKDPNYSVYVTIALSLICVLVQNYFYSRLSKISIWYFFKNAIRYELLVSSITILVLLLLGHIQIWYINRYYLILFSIVSFVIQLPILFYLGFNSDEQVSLKRFVLKKIRK